MDLPSNVDEMNQCKQAMRLAYGGEDIEFLLVQESAFVVRPWDLPGLRTEHVAKKAMAEGSLRYF